MAAEIETRIQNNKSRVTNNKANYTQLHNKNEQK